MRSITLSFNEFQRQLLKVKPADDRKRMELERLPDYGPLEIEDWQEFLKKSQVFFDSNWNKHKQNKETLNDFHQLKLLGCGTFGNVILIKHKENNMYYAMKAMEKGQLVKTNSVELAKTEKSILQSINFPNTIYLVYFFKDNTLIYLVMPFINGGELFGYIRKNKKLDEVMAKFYMSQIVLALEYLHFLDLIYRDLKPENILIDHTGYLKLTDFGFCKLMLRPRTYTLCGTPEYLAPEVILSKGYNKSVDWWAAGILTYELVAGQPPFMSNDPMKLYNKIISNKYKMPYSFSGDLKDLIKNLLQVNLSNRFGNMHNGVNDIKNHKWFRTINWMAILNRKVKSTYLPKLDGPGDTQNFDVLKWTPPPHTRENKYSEQFRDF